MNSFNLSAKGVTITVAIIIAAIILAVFVGSMIGSGDSDRDGLYNSEEETGWDITIWSINGTKSIHVTSNPNKQDTDGDGLTDYEEFFNSTNPNNPDTDGDGLTDYEELITYDTLPYNQDEDNDGLSDGIEIKGWNITLRGVTNIVTSDNSKIDTDGDFFNDLQEYNAKTNPRVKDTDGDGVWDFTDIDPLWNVKITVDLLNFTLLKNGAKPYFVVFAGGNYTTTPTLSIGFNETVSLNNNYDLRDADIPDSYNINEEKIILIRVSAADANQQDENNIDIPLKINGSQGIKEIKLNYPPTNYEMVYSTSGDDGVLYFKIIITRE